MLFLCLSVCLFLLIDLANKLHISWFKYSSDDLVCDVIIYCDLSCDMGRISMSDKTLMENLKAEKSYELKKSLHEFPSEGRRVDMIACYLRQTKARMERRYRLHFVSHIVASRVTHSI